MFHQSIFQLLSLTHLSGNRFNLGFSYRQETAEDFAVSSRQSFVELIGRSERVPLLLDVKRLR